MGKTGLPYRKNSELLNIEKSPLSKHSNNGGFQARSINKWMLKLVVESLRRNRIFA